jgi:hypothetical protein
MVAKKMPNKESSKEKKQSRAGKLTPELQAKICALIAAGATYELACGKCRIDRKTYYNWRQLGKEDPESKYGSLARAVEFAEVDSEALMVKTLLNHKDWRATSWIMKNRWPQKYRDKVEQELSGPDGEPIAMNMKPVQVIIRDAGTSPERSWEMVDYADIDKSRQSCN